jgi:hypothetical protein
MFGRFSRNDSGGRDGASTTFEINFGYAVAGWEKRVVGQRVDEDEDLQQRQDDQCEGPPCLKRRPQGVAFRNETLIGALTQAVRFPFEIFGHPQPCRPNGGAAGAFGELSIPPRELAQLSASGKPVRSLSCIWFSDARPRNTSRGVGSLTQVGVPPTFPLPFPTRAIADVPTTARRLPRPFLILNPRPP